ncbi:hypothetical protein A2U01_0037418, partial [Trifolium medium]|nr:hypothetical protein [Trifolium medium]
MGHTENRCEVRYSMESDDGRREWSGDIRANPRRQGGRQTSRWLREERGGGDGSSGDARRNQGVSMAEDTVSHTHADVEASSHNQPHHNNDTLIAKSVSNYLQGQPTIST